jgi:hypothetical protein
VAQSKTFLDKIGKALNAELKAKTKAVDTERAAIWDKLEALQKEIREPLTQWENREKERVDAHKLAMGELENITQFSMPPTIEQINERISRHSELSMRDWQEFKEMAESLISSRKLDLLAVLDNAVKIEAERKELEKLREEKASQEAKSIEEAKQKAADEERARIEKDAQERAQKAAEAAIQAEKEKAAKADQARIAAEAKAKLEAEQAVIRERERAAAEQKIIDDEAKKRENDRAHHAKINREAMEAIQVVINANLSGKETAKSIVVAIAEGKIPNVRIFY